MEVEASHAAVSAIAALQERIRELELEQEELKEERAKLLNILDERDNMHSMREEALNKATEKANQMIANITETMDKVQYFREENKNLRKQIAQSKEALTKSSPKQTSPRCSNTKLKADLKQIKQRLSDYECILGEILTTHPNMATLSHEDLVVISRETNQKNLSSKINKIYQSLNQLPKSFSRQKNETKRLTLRTLRKAMYAISEMSLKIEELEKQINREAEIQKLNIQIKILSNEITKFRIG
ncbi:hypothetical protein GPJ56_007081 [Histomonas meleagridis]|uniref:uncharacterized protein n=1 Tax=Histomonas meleagridis TaxID=135588 RepID=UPI0035593938|nr:hypothetical protein GPJ56_007081 [Histomonas meleagridis]KAH0799794.1 hypothetical protein GO595_007515 [Histomonas meleagridis]